MVSLDGKLTTDTSMFIVCPAIKKNIHFKHLKRDKLLSSVKFLHELYGLL